MNKLREILRLKEACGLSIRKIANAMKLSRPVVTEYLARCADGGMKYATAKDMPDDVLEVSRFRQNGKKSPRN